MASKHIFGRGIAHNGADKRRFFELVTERRKKCVEHGGAYNLFQACAPPAQTEDGESVSEAARSVYRLLAAVPLLHSILSLFCKLCLAQSN